MRILLVEDHQELAETIADVLRSDGLAVDVALDGEAALQRARVYSYDVIVLDRDLPGVHGDEVCRRLVAEGSASRVLMLTAAGSVEDLTPWNDSKCVDGIAAEYRTHANAGAARQPPPPPRIRHERGCCRWGRETSNLPYEPAGAAGS